MMLPKEIDDIEHDHKHCNMTCDESQLIAHTREQDAELTSLRETVRFLNDRMREMEAALAEAREFLHITQGYYFADIDHLHCKLALDRIALLATQHQEGSKG